MGIKRSYYDDGTLRAEGLFIDGLPHDIQRHFHPNGVLAEEGYFNHGIRDGIFKQWNDKGELLGMSELRNGTGIYRKWHENGNLSLEESLIEGRTTGRMRIYWEKGGLLEETYWLNSVKVSKKRYFAACEQNPNLPKYEDDGVRPYRPSWAKKKRSPKAPPLPAPTAEELDALPRKLLLGSHVREALPWLEENCCPSRSLGEATDQDDSLRLVKKLYKMGAVAVHAVEIQGGSDEDQNSGKLVVKLPQDTREPQETSQIQHCRLARQHGFDPDSDVGQQYMFLMLD